MAATKPLDCVLEYSRKALVQRGDNWITDQKRRMNLPEVPVGFQAIRGSYRHVSEHAIRLNKIQERSGFLDYLYSPEPFVEEKKEGEQ